MKYTKINVKSQLKPPFFIGSQIRGAFGYALKKVVCTNYKGDCANCAAQENCLFYDFYEAKNSAHNYRFDFHLKMTYYDFNLYLFENAIDKTSYVISALYLMMSEFGLGKDKTKHENIEIKINDEICLQDGKILLTKDILKDIITPPFQSEIELEFITPLRIKKDNRLLKNTADSAQIELKDLINSIYLRKIQIFGDEKDICEKDSIESANKRFFPHEIKGQIQNCDLHFLELSRFSNRQKSAMNLGGLIGKMKIVGLNKECYKILRLGEILGAGKQTAFGLGKFIIK